MRCPLPIVLAALFESTAHTVPHAWGQDQPTIARLQPGNQVEVLEARSNRWLRIYRSSEWGTTALSVAPSGDRLALLAWKPGVISGHEYAVPPAPTLTIIDRAGRTLAAIAQVQRYAWCGPTCVVYITGRYEESHFGFGPDGMGMLNVTTGVTTALPAPPHPIGVTWAGFDSAAYVKNRPRGGEASIYRLDIGAKEIRPTAFKDHLFSPTGRYYLHRPELTDTLVVYETRTNAPLDLPDLRGGANVLGWASSSRDILLTIRGDSSHTAKRDRPVRPRPRTRTVETRLQTYQLYDLPNRRALGSLTGRLGEYAAPDHIRVLERGGEYQVLDTQ
jgi:hypothetical protein